MICTDFEPLLADALGGELTAADGPKFYAHIAACASCRTAYQEGSSAVSVLRSLPGPQRVALETDTAIGAADAAKTGRPRAANALLRYAASVLVAFAAGYALSGVRTPSPQDRTTAQRPSQKGLADGGSFRIALARVHQRNPSRSDLAKGMITLFGARR